jgi:hypothetical protein
MDVPCAARRQQGKTHVHLNWGPASFSDHWKLRMMSDTKESLRARWPAWMREPLLHFVLLGALLFALDALLLTNAEDPNVIIIAAAVDEEARAVFKAARGRNPNREELYALRRVWLDNEVLYREGLSMQLDKGDKAIRERVIFKALSVVDAGTRLPLVDDAVLRAWFEAHREKYDEPTRYSFQEAVPSGEKSEPGLRSFVAALNRGNPGNVEADLRVFTNRPHENLVSSYGEQFAEALEQAKPGEWQVLPSNQTWRAVKLDAISQPIPADYAQLRSVVVQDWTDAVLAEQRSAAVEALARKYEILVEDGTE